MAPGRGSLSNWHACGSRITEHPDDGLRRRGAREVRLPRDLSVPRCGHLLAAGYQSVCDAADRTSQKVRFPTRARNVDPNGGKRIDGHLFLGRGDKFSDVSNWNRRAIFDLSLPRNLVRDRWRHQVQTGLPRRSSSCAAREASEPASPLLREVDHFGSAVELAVDAEPLASLCVYELSEQHRLFRFSSMCPGRLLRAKAP